MSPWRSAEGRVEVEWGGLTTAAQSPPERGPRMGAAEGAGEAGMG